MDFTNRIHWLSFAEAAWNAAGRPDGLDPSIIEIDPVAYDRSYYEYFERCFFDLWLNIYNRVKPTDGTLIKIESPEFCLAWHRNFSWETTWKQLLPLFVYGRALGVNNEVLVELGSQYCIAQAIPSTVIDRMLDEGSVATSSSDAAFCIVGYAKGLSGIRSLRLPSSAALEDCFLSHTRSMYDSMLQEDAQRFTLPPQPLSDVIGSYFASNSRLLSSIFFGVLPRWAYLVAGRELPSSMVESLDALRRVRQLNDEISDVQEDLAHGLVTLPWLYAIEEDPELRNLIEQFWQRPESADAGVACRDHLRKSRGMQRASAKSLEFLSKSMRATTTGFPISKAFELSLLHNVRWAHLTRIRLNDYEDIRPPRQPFLPHRVITSASNLITPVGGAGTLVVREDGKILMSLVLKRGMLRWELPAGVAEDGESMEQAAQRETFEETGRRVAIEDPLALCWHYSCELGKGWMGIFFRARIADETTMDDFRAIKNSTLVQSKVNFVRNPELYESFEPDKYNFELIRQQSNLRPTAHENVLASGFVEWLRIPKGRIHPLHRELLEALPITEQVGPLVGNADADRNAYDKDAPLYFV